MKQTIHIETIVVGQMATNCYIVKDLASGDALIIDPGDDAEHISDVLTRLHASPTMIVATHGHFDHIMGAYALQLMYNIPFVIHEADMFLLRTMQSSAMHFLRLPQVDPPPKIMRFIRDKDALTVGKQKVMIIHTPGHTPGSVCLHLEDVLFAGDTIFADGAVGRSDHSYSDPLKLSASIKTILSYPVGTRLLSGHGEESIIK